MATVQEDVGACAGEIYACLAKEGKEVSVMQLLKNIQREDDLIMAALGWLLREEKIDVARGEKGMTVRLK